VEGVRVGLASEGRQGKDRPGPTIAKGNDDLAEMDCRTITNGGWSYVFNLLAAHRDPKQK
jgi:hypothetical protein